jgi:hypothetical protein
MLSKALNHKKSMNPLETIKNFPVLMQKCQRRENRNMGYLRIPGKSGDMMHGNYRVEMGKRGLVHYITISLYGNSSNRQNDSAEIGTI